MIAEVIQMSNQGKWAAQLKMLNLTMSDIIICDGNNAVYQKCTDKDKTYT